MTFHGRANAFGSSAQHSRPHRFPDNPRPVGKCDGACGTQAVLLTGHFPVGSLPARLFLSHSGPMTRAPHEVVIHQAPSQRSRPMSSPHTCLSLCHCVPPVAHTKPQHAHIFLTPPPPPRLTLLSPSRSLNAAPAVPVLPCCVRDGARPHTQLLPDPAEG